MTEDEDELKMNDIESDESYLIGPRNRTSSSATGRFTLLLAVILLPNNHY